MPDVVKALLKVLDRRDDLTVVGEPYQHELLDENVPRFLHLDCRITSEVLSVRM